MAIGRVKKSTGLYVALGQNGHNNLARERFANRLSREPMHEIRTALDFSMPLGND
jgi:hypothetical protein